MNKNEELYAVWMLLCAQKYPTKLAKTVNSFNSAEEIYNCEPRKFGPSFTDSEIELFSDKDLTKAREILEYCERESIKIIPFSSPEFPLSLRNLSEPVCALFVRGNYSFVESRPAVGMVGTRDASEYGKKVAATLAYDLSKAGVTIVSGMAKGIDTYAHKGTLLAENPTVAVLAGGVEHIYPAENSELYRRIIENGAVISEYLPKTVIQRYMFHKRNRIISALSDAVIVVESDLTGGSLITAEHAIEQKKILCAVPGPIFEKTSLGTNELIKNGALSVMSANDVLKAINEKNGTNLSVPERKPKMPEPKVEQPVVEEKPKKTAAEKKKPIVDVKPISEMKFGSSENEDKIVKYILKYGESSLDSICGALGFTFSQCVTIVGMMEMDGILIDTGCGLYRLSDEIIDSVIKE